MEDKDMSNLKVHCKCCGQIGFKDYFVRLSGFNCCCYYFCSKDCFTNYMLNKIMKDEYYES